MSSGAKIKKKKKSAKSAIGTLFIAAVLAAAGIFFSRIEETGFIPDIGRETAVPEAEIPEDRFLILVNSKNSIPEGYVPELTELANGERVDSGIYPDLQRMFDDMRAEGIYPVVGEGYRTQTEQRQMMRDKVAAFEDEGYSKTEAEKAAREYVAEVGTSEHELGLAVDINADKEKSDNEQVYEWLYENAYRYGFILRYPADKFSVTGISYEPWHYRYVGEYAEEIYKSGLCLEEWIGKK